LAYGLLYGHQRKGLNTMTALINMLGAFGLSSAAGLNAYIPLLIVGLLGRYDYVPIEASFEFLTSVPVLAILGVLALLDFVADKIPAVDHLTHVAGLFVHPISGAVVFASQSHLLSNLHPVLALIAGSLVAGGFHATRATIRPAATTTTGGVGNPVLSFIEDVMSLLMTLVAIFLPLLAAILFVLLLVLLFRALRSRRYRRRVSQLRW
jgi:hypothetical protein